MGAFGVSAEPYVLDQSPDVLSIGRRCVQDGYSLQWRPYSLAPNTAPRRGNHRLSIRGLLPRTSTIMSRVSAPLLHPRFSNPAPTLLNDAPTSLPAKAGTTLVKAGTTMSGIGTNLGPRLEPSNQLELPSIHRAAKKSLS